MAKIIAEQQNVSENKSSNPSFDAYFMEGLLDRKRLFNFLDVSYRGGKAYKEGCDVYGLPLLIPHELELSGSGDSPQTLNAIIANTGNSEDNRFLRRLRTSSYKNFTKPIISRFAAYVTRNDPKRYDTDELDRIKIKPFIDEMILEGLKLTEVWVGYDTVQLDEFDEDGSLISYTENDIAVLDPEHQGRPYPVMIDARNVVDFDEDENGVIHRVVFEEIEEFKDSFTAKKSKVTNYKEWTTTGWKTYRKVKSGDSKNSFNQEKTSTITNTLTGSSVRVELISEGSHSFEEVPFRPFRPRFPTEDLADLNRLLFNIESLVDEELFSSTFTQKVITGASADEVKTATTGSGNTLVIENQDATLDVIGSIEGQAASLMDRCRHIVEDIYRLTAMDSGQKNVAEAAEKKKRDLEALYTLLIQVAKDAEIVENELLIGMGIIEAGDTNQLSVYDRKFDIASIAEMLEELESLGRMPFVPGSFKRMKALQIMRRLDTHNEFKDYKTSEDMIDTTTEMVEAIEVLLRMGIVTPEAIATALGLPTTPEIIKMIQEKMSSHREADDVFGDDEAAQEFEDDKNGKEDSVIEDEGFESKGNQSEDK